MSYQLGAVETTTAELPVTQVKKPRFSTYVMGAGIGLFLLGNLGWWLAKGRRSQRKFEKIGQTVAIVGILIRGAGEVIEFRKKTA